MTNNRGKAKQTKQNDISLAIIDGDVVLFLNVAWLRYLRNAGDTWWKDNSHKSPGQFSMVQLY